MQSVHVSARVTRRIRSLEQAGKAGRALAGKAAAIIGELTSGGLGRSMESAGRYTRYGEKRIRHCRKFDLGCGFRLVTLQRDRRVYVPFLGTLTTRCSFSSVRSASRIGGLLILRCEARAVSLIDWP